MREGAGLGWRSGKANHRLRWRAEWILWSGHSQELTSRFKKIHQGYFVGLFVVCGIETWGWHPSSRGTGISPLTTEAERGCPRTMASIREGSRLRTVEKVPVWVYGCKTVFYYWLLYFLTCSLDLCEKFSVWFVQNIPVCSSVERTAGQTVQVSFSRLFTPLILMHQQPPYVVLVSQGPFTGRASQRLWDWVTASVVCVVCKGPLCSSFWSLFNFSFSGLIWNF